jgi:adenosine kinase
MESSLNTKIPKVGLEEGMLVGIGNPLLDISTNCNEEFLKKYDLEPNNAILAEKKHLPLYQDIVSNLKVDFIAGGATLNTMRVSQWLIGKPDVISYFGCVGDDEYSKILVEKSKEAGVNIKPQVNKENSTGTCAVLINGSNRSLVANLAAANHFQKSHFDIKENWDIVKKADYFYIGGFFLTVSPESILELAKHACMENKYCAMNLSAPFLCQFFSEPMMKCLPYIDLLFANETEAAAFSKMANLETDDIKEIALKTAALDKLNKNRERMVVFTQGCLPTIVAFEGKITEYAVIECKKEDIVDTNGAGDSFVGGFLSEFIQGKSVSRCVQVGNYAAHYIIRQSGVTLNEKPNIPSE